MGVFDQAARYATQADPGPVVARLLRDQGVPFRFQGWEDTRPTPLPGGQDRTADRVASLLDEMALDRPWLLVFEFQAQHDPDKLDVTLVEAAQLRAEMRHGEQRRGKYHVLVALIYLRGRCPEEALDMTLPSGRGILHAPLVWNVADDSASDVLMEMESGRTTWGMLYFVPLMRGGSDLDIIERWKARVKALPEERRRGDLAEVALVFSELAGCFLAWEQALEDWHMTESMVVNRWIEKARVEEAREFLKMLLDGRFQGEIPGELLETIQQQPSIALLKEWFKEANRAASIEDFLKVVRR